MTPALVQIIEEAYRVFSEYKIGRTLTVCHCNSCMTEENESLLIKTPLRSISASLLAEYTGSAHEWDDGPVAREMRYFLPRYLELIAANDPPCTMGLDICLRRLGHAGWRAKWPDLEVRLLDRFFDALLVSALEQLDMDEWPAGFRLRFAIIDVFTMLITAGGDLDRVLAVWDGADDPGGAIHMASLRADVLHFSNGPLLHSAYLERDHVAEAEKIGRFLMRPEVDERLERAFFLIDDPRLQQLVSDALYTSSHRA